MMPIAVNGKFLTAGVDGGVHRSAAHFTRLLVQHARASGVPIRVVAPAEPPAGVDLGTVEVEVVPGRLGGGQRWEMTTLPWITRNELLVNFCNLGPVAHRRSVVMIHDTQTQLFPGDYPLRQRIGYQAVQRSLGLTAQRILTVSEFSKGMLRLHHLASPSRIDVVPNGCDHLLGVTADVEVLRRHGLREGSYVLALGHVEEYKNLDVLFRALPDPVDGTRRLVLTGSPGRQDYQQRGWTPPPHTLFTGWATDGELRALYEGASVVAVPSLTEGFGLPPLEAMACGTPVVAARAGAIPEVCGDAALLVDPVDASAWADALRIASTDESVRCGLIERGRQRADYYSWARAGERLWRSLEPLVGISPTRPLSRTQVDDLDVQASALNVAVVVASVGRPDCLAHLLDRLAEQTKLPSQVILSVASDEDLPVEAPVPFALDVIVEEPRGLPLQRNRGLTLVKPDTDIVVFYDDDFVPSTSAIADVARFFAANPDIAGADGLVLADGAVGPGISLEEALQLVAEADRAQSTRDLSVAGLADGLYGCNMAYRYQAVRDLRFDEELPLYAWFEDLDFSARVPGRLVHCRAFRGVHRGEKKGRENGRRLGYSQVANPIYLAHKGSLSVRYCVRSVLRRVIINHLRSVRPEPWVDRRGRVMGNWLAIADLVRGRLHPQRIVEL